MPYKKSHCSSKWLLIDLSRSLLQSHQLECSVLNVRIEFFLYNCGLQGDKLHGKSSENAGNLKIPLANGNVMNIPLSAINITEEVNKTGIWKQVNEFNVQEKGKKKSPKSSR